MGADSLIRNPAFQPHILVRVFLENYGTHISGLFYNSFAVTSAGAAAVLGGMLAAAFVLRNRMLAFSALVAILAFLPIGFIASRNGYAMYVPFAGWVMYAASLAVKLRDWLLQMISTAMMKVGAAPRQNMRVLRPLPILVCFACFVVPQNYHGSRLIRDAISSDQYALHSSYQQISQMRRKLSPGARILLVRDSSPPRTPAIYFLIRLFYDDPALQVIRAKEFCAAGKAVPVMPYDLILDYDQGHYVDLTSRWDARGMAGICARPEEYVDQFGKVIRPANR
jgi:hypothetical protein